MVNQVGILAFDNGAQVVNKDLRDIVIAGIETADEAAQRLKTSQLVLSRINHAGLMPQVEAHALRSLDADHAAALCLCGRGHHIHQLFGLAFALSAHNQSDHMKSLLI